MLTPCQNRPRANRRGPEDTALYALQDFLEMRTELSERKRNGLLEQISRHLVLAGEIQPLPAFMVGAQAVLCLKENAPETYWVYSPKMECLHSWNEPATRAAPWKNDGD